MRLSLYQFGIFFLIFILLEWIFLSKLQFVIETRQNRTTKLEESADKKFQKSEALFNKYCDEIPSCKGFEFRNIRKGTS